MPHRTPSDALHLTHAEQAVVIPAYLLCVAVGQLQSREVGPRTAVWSARDPVHAQRPHLAAWHLPIWQL